MSSENQIRLFTLNALTGIVDVAAVLEVHKLFPLTDYLRSITAAGKVELGLVAAALVVINAAVLTMDARAVQEALRGPDGQ